MTEQSNTYSVQEANEEDAANWQEFALQHAPAHHAYDWRWKEVLTRTFSHKAHYLICRNDGDRAISGILPLFHVKSALFGKSLISLPYLNGGGPVAVEQKAIDALSMAARKLARKEGVRYLELRARDELPALEADHEVRSHKVAMLLPLQADPEMMFKSFPAKLRSQIRRPSKSGILSEIKDGSSVTTTDISMFYSVFSRNMRDLGTPVYPRKLFSETLRVFGEDAKIIVVRREKTVMACGLTVKFGNSVEIPWASSLRKYNTDSPNMLLYWSAIKDACLSGASFFDFGRSSPDAGTFRFKKQWGSSPLALHWYYAKELDHIPDINPQNSSFSTLVKIWQRLPLPIANTAGPWLSKSLP